MGRHADGKHAYASQKHATHGIKLDELLAVCNT